MKALLRSPGFCALVFACIALPTHAADRMRAGQWVGSTVVNGKTFASSTCVTQSDVDAMNGDARSVRANLEKSIPPEICKLSDVKASGSQIVYTSSCQGGAPNVVTTTYHGDSFESTSSKGVTSTGKLTGTCK